MWELDIDSSHITLDDNGTLYVSYESGNEIYAIRTNEEGLRKNSWSKYGGNILNGGAATAPQLSFNDYDADGKADFAGVLPQSTLWVVGNSTGDDPLLTSNDGVTRLQFGRQYADIPISGDFDGDGRADIAFRRPSEGRFVIKNSGGVDLQNKRPSGLTIKDFGSLAEDIPVPADYDGDGMTDIAVWRPSTGYWFINNSSGIDEITGRSDGVTRISFGGQNTDIPVPGDYDGDGKVDIAVRRPSTGQWIIRNSNGIDPTGVSSSSITRINFGNQDEDIPVPADYDGDGKTDIAIRRPNTGEWIIRNSSGFDEITLNTDGLTRIQFGIEPHDIAIPADYDGDGKTDIAIRRPRIYTQYILQSSSGVTKTDIFGKNTNIIPVAAPILTRINMLKAQTPLQTETVNN